MQHIKTLAAAMIIFIFAASCKKENVQDPVAPATVVQKKIVEEKNLTTGDFKKYSYDAQGRVSKVESGTNSWTVVYQSNMIIVHKKRLSNNTSLGTEEYTIDALGKMISAVWRSTAGVITYRYEYEYDPAGYMIRMKETYDNGEYYEDFVTNPSGNPVTVKNYYNGTLNDVTDYYYNADVKSKGLGTILIGTYGISGFAGKEPQRELSEFKRYNPSGNLSYHKVCTFTTDAAKNILSFKATYPLTGQEHNIQLTYQQ